MKLVIMERGVTFPTSACGVRPITMHCAGWPIVGRRGFVENDAFERRGIEELQ